MVLGSNSSGHLFDTTLNSQGILYSDGSGVINSTTVGTSTHVLISNGTGVAPTFQSVSASGAVITLTGDTGGAISPTAGNINILATTNAGSSVSLAGSGSTLSLKVTDASFNTIMGSVAGNGTLSGASNTGFGVDVLHGLTTGSFNVAFGTTALEGCTTGTNNATLGGLTNLLTGSYNVALGSGSGNNYSTSESSNILISNVGLAAESNVIKIGTQGSGTGQQNVCYIAGITGVSVSNQTIVTQNSSTQQMGAVTSVPVANGGTGAATLTGVLTGNGTSAVTANTVTQNGVLIGGASNAVSSLGVAATGTILSGTTSSAPSFKSFSVVRQVFTSTGTYTPTSGMLYCTVRVVGGGGAGGGAAATGVSTSSVGAGGGAGEYAEGVFSAATVGASQAVTIAAAATGVSGAGGNNGGTCSLGALITAAGGTGGAASAASATVNADGGAGGTGGSGGSFRTPGQSGDYGYANTVSIILTGGYGGSGQLGAGGSVSDTGASNQGQAGQGKGSGGGGSCNYVSQSALLGGAGAQGEIVITEYVIS